MPAKAGSPALSCKKKRILFFHIINSLLNKLFLLGWLNICFASFLRFYRPWLHFSVHKSTRTHKNSAHIKPPWPHAWSISRLIYPTVTFMIYEFQCNGDARHFDGIFTCDKPWLFSQYSSFEDHYFNLCYYRLSGGFVRNSRSIIYCSKVKKSQWCVCYSVRSLVKENNNFRWDFLRQTKQNDKNPDKSTKQKKKRHLGKQPTFPKFLNTQILARFGSFPAPSFFSFFPKSDHQLERLCEANWKCVVLRPITKIW